MISIIIPVHNSEKYIERCVQSILKQKKDDYEIILVENGSTDRTVEVCRNLEYKYKQLRFIKMGACGVSAARNKGILEAIGEWVVFVDSDDELQDKALDIITSSESEVMDIVISAYSREREKNIVEDTLQEIPSKLLVASMLQFAKYQKKLKEYSMIDSYSVWTCWGKFYRRKFLLENKIFFPEGIYMGEDAAFNFLAYECAKRIMVTRQNMYVYYFNTESVIVRNHTDLLENNLKLIEWIEDKSRIIGIKEKYEKELQCFYVNAVIDACKNSLCKKNIFSPDVNRANLLKNVCEKEIIRNAIRRTSYVHLILGKRNILLYSKKLFFLKHRMYSKVVGK